MKFENPSTPAEKSIFAPAPQLRSLEVYITPDENDEK
jgi:hypothetical protein